MAKIIELIELIELIAWTNYRLWKIGIKSKPKQNKSKSKQNKSNPKLKLIKSQKSRP